METTSSKQGTSRSNEDVWFQVILELQRAFAHMKYSSHGVVDLNRFVGKKKSIYMRIISVLYNEYLQLLLVLLYVYNRATWTG